MAKKKRKAKADENAELREGLTRTYIMLGQLAKRVDDLSRRVGSTSLCVELLSLRCTDDRRRMDAMEKAIQLCIEAIKKLDRPAWCVRAWRGVAAWFRRVEESAGDYNETHPLPKGKNAEAPKRWAISTCWDCGCFFVDAESVTVCPKCREKNMKNPDAAVGPAGRNLGSDGPDRSDCQKERN